MDEKVFERMGVRINPCIHGNCAGNEQAPLYQHLLVRHMEMIVHGHGEKSCPKKYVGLKTQPRLSQADSQPMRSQTTTSSLFFLLQVALAPEKVTWSSMPPSPSLMRK